jgi:UDP-N-acetylmuramoyl-tripeptide--D-alanyl-D-alanine ligase
MKFSWSLQDILSATNGKLITSGTPTISGFSIDTRSIKENNVFIALSGENFDGHKFIEAAIQKKCSLIIASRIPEDFKPEIPVIKVNDTLKALQDLAEFYRNKHSATFIGVTGSNGKTTTKEMLLHLFSKQAKTSATKGNLNNHIGLPLTILSVPFDTKIAIIEMGMNHQGEIRRLCQIAKPQISIITNIGPAHIGILGSLENIAKAKAEILENLPENGKAIVPGDSEFLSLLAKTSPVKTLSVGTAKNCDYKISDIEMSLSGLSFSINHNSKKIHPQLSTLGKHNAINASIAIAAYIEMGFPPEQAAKDIESFKQVQARMEAHDKDGINVLVDCYNANSSSMKEALSFLGICPARKIAVLGDMRELGNKSEELHREIGKVVSENNIDILITVGEEAKFIANESILNKMNKTNVISLNSNDQAAEYLVGKLKKGDTILFKASRGMHFEKIIQRLWPDLGKELH